MTPEDWWEVLPTLHPLSQSPLPCTGATFFRVGLIVDASNHLTKAVLTSGFLARHFIGAKEIKKAVDLLCERTWTKARERASQTLL